MGVQETGLTLEGLAKRLEALERENERMHSENAGLRDKLAALEETQTRRGESTRLQRSQPSHRADMEPASGLEGMVSRRSLLSKAGAAAVAAVAAGTLMNPREAKAFDADPAIVPDSILTHRLISSNHLDSEPAVSGRLSNDTRGAVEGDNFGSGPGVRGRSETAAVEGIATGLSGTGVEGKTEGSNGTGVKGTGRYGVWGESNQAGFYGVTGRNTNTDGTGVRGVGAKRGVLGESTNGIGVKGTSSAPGLGAVEGHNSGGGTGVAGVGKVGMLGFSHTDGWNAVWGRHTANGRGVAGDSARGVGVYGEASSEGKQGVFGRAKGASQGVAGEGLNGTGVLGTGRFGVVGASTGAGYGGQFQGGKAQLRIVPKGTVGRPTTGAHAKGEIYMDSAATLFVCTVGGTPGTWRKIATTIT